MFRQMELVRDACVLISRNCKYVTEQREIKIANRIIVANQLILKNGDIIWIILASPVLPRSLK
jgi:hypothetical protein